MMENIENRIEYLREFMLPERFEKLHSRLINRTHYMALCLEDIYYPHNASAVIRSAEAFGIQQIHAVQSLCKFTPSHNIVRGTDQWIELHKWSDTPTLVAHLREQGYRIVVTSPRESGSTPESFDVAAGKFALFMGTEKTGISEWLMNEADDYVHIPMVGFAESLNISVSAAIITNRLTERIRENSEIDWQLSTTQQSELLYKWVYRSIKDVDNILARGNFPKIPLK